MTQYFQELLHWQAEVAQAIVELQKDIAKYEDLAMELWQRKERDIVRSYLGLKNEYQEIGYALHYVQEQLQTKQKELKQLQDDLEQRINTVISRYQTV